MSFIIKNVYSGLVLDVKESNSEHGAEIILYPYHGYENQQWVYKNGMIISKLNGFVLDIRPKSNAIILSNTHYTNSPKWRFNDDLTISNKSGKVLDAECSGTEPCTRIIGYQKHGGKNQQFVVVPYDEEEEGNEEEEENCKVEEHSSQTSKRDTETSCYSNAHFSMIPPPPTPNMPMFPYMNPWFYGNMNYGFPQVGQMPSCHFGQMQTCPCPSCFHYNNQMRVTQGVKSHKSN